MLSLLACPAFILNPTTRPAPLPAISRAAVSCAEAPRAPRISIEYCTRCNWMLRSAWLSQELLTTFNGTLAEVALQPNHEGTGTFTVCLDEKTDGKETVLVWSREEEGRFPEASELKQRVRDVLDPERSLGHSDTERTYSGPPSARSAVQRLLDR